MAAIVWHLYYLADDIVMSCCFYITCHILPVMADSVCPCWQHGI